MALKGLRKLSLMFFLCCLPLLSAADSGKFAVGGKATLMVEPDYVTVLVLIRSSAGLAAEASEEVTDLTMKLLKIARNRGVLETDVKTTGIMVSENRRRRDECADQSLMAYQSLTLILRDLESVEATIDQLIEGGGWVQQVRPGVTEAEAHHNRALQIAIDDARASASAAAQQLDLVLGDAIEVSFDSSGETQAYSYSTAQATGGFSSSNTYLPGLIPISQSVQVVFKANADVQ